MNTLEHQNLLGPVVKRILESQTTDTFEVVIAPPPPRTYEGPKFVIKTILRKKAAGVTTHSAYYGRALRSGRVSYCRAAWIVAEHDSMGGITWFTCDIGPINMIREVPVDYTYLPNLAQLEGVAKFGFVKMLVVAHRKGWV